MFELFTKNFRDFKPLLPMILLAGCTGIHKVPPVVLYADPPRPPQEISIIRIVKANSGTGNPTLRILKISGLGDSFETFYDTQSGESWAPPGHFMGPPETQRSTAGDDPATIPYEFQLLPGQYQIEFVYLPAVDKWGWRHSPQKGSSTWLECEAGYVYVLEGVLEEDGGFSLRKGAVREGGE